MAAELRGLQEQFGSVPEEALQMITGQQGAVPTVGEQMPGVGGSPRAGAAALPQQELIEPQGTAALRGMQRIMP